jgi:hypothetical protein
VNLQINRTILTSLSTIGDFLIDSAFAYCSLELPWNGGKNLQKLNCILPGTYELIITRSPHLKYETPILLNVPMRDDIRIHIANYPEDILGCIGIGLSRGLDFIGQSRLAFDDFFPRLQEALKTGRVFIEVVNKF